ncbi:MAG: hypothetical protein ABIQ88_09600 [Chitinophagaceae bacterium]
MIKRIIILLIASCFFLENIAICIVIRNNKTYYIEDSGENDASENEDGAKKDKKEDYKINSPYKYFFVSDKLNNNFHFFDEQTYFEYCPEINLPPPDTIKSLLSC